MRDLFPDVLKGMITREEAQDIEVEIIRSEPVIKESLSTVVKNITGIEADCNNYTVTRQDDDTVIIDAEMVRTPEPEPPKEETPEETALRQMDEADSIEKLVEVAKAASAAGIKSAALAKKWTARQAELKRK